MKQIIEQRVRELIIAQLYHLEFHERLMDNFEDEEGDQLDEAINKIARETMYAPDILAACKLAKQHLDAMRMESGIGNVLLPFEKAAFEQVDDALTTAIAKTKGVQCSV